MNADGEPWSKPFADYVRYRGKAGRGHFWVGMVVTVLALVLALALFAPYFSATGASDPFAKVLVFAILGAAIWLHSAICIARLRDRGRPAWWYLIYGIAPFVLYYVGWKTEGNISNQPAPISIVAQLAALLLWLAGLIDLGFMKGAAGPAAQAPNNG